MADVFISYAHEDRGRIKGIVEAIEHAGYAVWWDRRIGLGNSFEREIERELDAAGCIVVVWSSHSVNSDWVRNEAQEGLDRGILVPLLVDDVRPPLAFRRAQTAALSPRLSDDELEPVLAAVDACMRRSTPSSASSPAPVSTAREGQRRSETAIAVIPFENLSSDPEQEFFSEGIAEDILDMLAQKTDFIIRPRSSSFVLKASNVDSQSIGKRLNVTHLVEGAVRKSGNRVRISAQLVDVATNRPLWSHRYDRSLTDIFRVQDEISNEVLSALDALLNTGSTTSSFSNSDAYDTYLRARSAFNQYEFRDADDWLAKAVAIEPRNADIWALRAKVNAYQSAYELSPNSGTHRTLRRRYQDNVLSIYPTHPIALAQRALMDVHYTDRNYQAAIEQLLRLADDYPNDEDTLIYLTFVLATVGRADLVARVTEELVRLAPLSRQAWITRIAWGGLLFGTVDQAKKEFAKFPSAGPVVGAQIALAEGDEPSLVEYASQLKAATGTESLYSALVPYVKGDLNRARAIAEKMMQSQGYVSFRIKALLSLVERDIDGAFAHYKEAILAGEPNSISTIHGLASWRKVFPEFYADERFNRMLEEFRLDPVSTGQLQIPNLRF